MHPACITSLIMSTLLMNMSLATYLGHRHVSDTYWYISAAPELLQLATERLERKQGEPLS